MSNTEKYNSIFTGEEIDEAVGHVQEMTKKYKHTITMTHQYPDQSDYIFVIICDTMAPIEHAVESEFGKLLHGCYNKQLYLLDPVDNTMNEYPLISETYAFSDGNAFVVGMYKLGTGGVFSRIDVLEDPNYSFVSDEVEEV